MNAPFQICKGGRGAERKDAWRHLALLPSQQIAFDRLADLLPLTNVIGLASDPGMGRSTILRAAAQKFGGRLISMSDLVQSIRFSDSDDWDLALFDYVLRQLRNSDILYVDGLQNFGEGYASRGAMVRQPLATILMREAEIAGKTLVLGGRRPTAGGSIRGTFYQDDLPIVEIPRFGIQDYVAMAKFSLGETGTPPIDFAQIFRMAPLMSAHELRIINGIGSLEADLTTARYIELIEQFVVSANTRTREVEEISFASMPGTDEIADALETHVVLPLTEPALAERFDLRAKRGVLLYGPPGTGKTSVGRALAHRLKGRFFLIDGSVKTEPAWAFHGKISAIIEDAIANAPSVLFIDDADVLFEIGYAAGFARYLLTILDGLAGESASKVTIMMTAMDASKIPEAVLRSGRVELWLETRVPDQKTRSDIIKRWLGGQLPDTNAADFDAVAKAADGFTPADLRRIVGDARAHYAADLDAEQPHADAETYLLRAIEGVIATREAMALNLADPSLRIK